MATTRTQTQPGSRLIAAAPWLKPLLLLSLLALCLRAPFVNQAFQLDDNYYLEGAKYVQTDPAHPSRTSYVFLGDKVDMRGHPHPPLDVWILGLVLRITGRISEVPFHIAYWAFTLIALWGMYFLARRFSPHPVYATLLFMAIPAFVVHGNALESDIPFLAFWMSGAAAFVYAVDRGDKRLLLACAGFLALASLAAYQAVFFVPILATYVWLNRGKWRAAYAVSLVPLIVIAIYQLYDRASNGALPASVLVGHFRAYGWQSAHNKLRNALALTGHMAWMLCPVLAVASFLAKQRRILILAAVAAIAGIWFDPNPLFWASFGTGAGVIAYTISRLRNSEPDALFLCAWIALFFAGSLVIFFAGSARYLLPLGAPLALLCTRELQNRTRLIAGGVIFQLVFGVCLAWVHYQHSDGYRSFVRSLAPEFKERRVWINGEWGLQYYGLEAGGLPLLRDQLVPAGDMVISNRLGYPIPFATPAARRRTVAEMPITPALPLRVIALGSHSAFSTISFGVRPFDMSTGPADVLRAELIEAVAPRLSWLPMNAPEAAEQIAGGIHELEESRWRWAAGKAVLVVKPPSQPTPLEADFTIPENAPGRRVSLYLNGLLQAQDTYPGPGQYTLRTRPLKPEGASAVVTIRIDRTFSVPGDRRELGLILVGAGFRDEAPR